jgi:CheY-like chemotaxis protein
MNYFLLAGSEILGPFEARDLVGQAGFCAQSVVCPEGAKDADAWQPASRFPEIAAALQGPPPDASEITSALGGAIVPAPSRPASPPPPPPPPPSRPGASPPQLKPPPLKPPPPPLTAPPPPPIALTPPAPPPAPSSAEPAAAPRPSPTTKLIMIVDDSDFTRDLMVNAVQTEGFQVVTADNGLDASRKLEPEPDLIITELAMPRQGGYEFICSLRADGHGSIPVIVVTAGALAPNRIEAIRQQGDIVEFMTKPLNMLTLLALIHGRLGTESRKLKPTAKKSWLVPRPSYFQTPPGEPPKT